MYVLGGILVWAPTFLWSYFHQPAMLFHGRKKKTLVKIEVLLKERQWGFSSPLSSSAHKAQTPGRIQPKFPFSVDGLSELPVAALD